MTIDRRGFLLASSSALVLGKTNLLDAAREQAPEQPEPPAFDHSVEARPIAVYTTADKTDFRLSATDTLAFTRMGQPLESQVCVFVDPSKRSQTILGVGGALTLHWAQRMALAASAQPPA